MSKISRKGFLKIAAATAVSGIAAGALTACNSASSSTAASSSAASSTAGLTYTPGTYEATAKGVESDIKVSVTFSKDKIEDIVIDVSGETAGIGADIGDKMKASILDAQTCSVDGISGATITSNAVKTAVADCMSQASGTVVTVGVEVEATESDPDIITVTSTVEADAVVVGCGAAGMMAALELQAAGIKTILLEKGATCGVSNGCMAGGPALAETRVQAAENATVSIETLYNCQYGFSKGTVNGALLRKCIGAGERVVSNFMDNGVNMGLRRDAYGMGFRARHNFSNLEGTQVSGAPRFEPLVAKFVSDGGTFEVCREAVKPVMDGEKVVGIIAKNTEDKTYIQYNAKAVLIATGGYAGNQERLREHFGDINVWPLCNELSDGKGYDIVIEAGGIADRNWALCCNEFGGVNGKMEQRGKAMVRSNDTLRFAIYGGLMVDPNGDRFMNEQYLSDRPLALGGEMSLRVGKYYAVVDQTMYEECRDKGILAYFGNPAEWYVGSTGYTTELLPNLDEHMQIAIERGWAVKGTLAECAEAFGLTDLEQTVADYNAKCAAGRDDQFFKSSYMLRELTGDTFYVVEYEPSIWGTFGGVKTDSYARAVNAQQQPIQGLYVAGVDNGSLYASPYYENEGAALGTAYTSGIVAADCMIQDLKG